MMRPQLIVLTATMPTSYLPHLCRLLQNARSRASLLKEVTRETSTNAKSRCRLIFARQRVSMYPRDWLLSPNSYEIISWRVQSYFAILDISHIISGIIWNVNWTSWNLTSTSSLAGNVVFSDVVRSWFWRHVFVSSRHDGPTRLTCRRHHVMSGSFFLCRMSCRYLIADMSWIA